MTRRVRWLSEAVLDGFGDPSHLTRSVSFEIAHSVPLRLSRLCGALIREGNDNARETADGYTTEARQTQRCQRLRVGLVSTATACGIVCIPPAKRQNPICRRSLVGLFALKRPTQTRLLDINARGLTSRGPTLSTKTAARPTPSVVWHPHPGQGKLANSRQSRTLTLILSETRLCSWAGGNDRARHLPDP